MAYPTAVTLAAHATAIAEDRDAGASELLARLLPILQEAIAGGPGETLAIARIVCEGQPAMAPLWHACAAAVAEATQPGTFALARAALERAPRALVRAAGAALSDLLAGEQTPLILTVSYSSSVARVFAELTASAKATAVKKLRAPYDHKGNDVGVKSPPGVRSADLQVRVICGEGQPGLEGRRLAGDLASAGIDATVVIDAALTRFLPDAAAVVMGADAICAERWINKVGSFGLAAAASYTGTPTYVIASRDKFVPAILEPRLSIPPLFERIPSTLATLFLTDAGPLSPVALPQAVDRSADQISFLLNQL